jgi:SNF2 family DNA or RNA helicase
MIYDTKKRRFIFQNKAAVPPSAILFYDLPALLSPGEDICPEVSMLAEKLPQMTATGANNCCAGALRHQIEAIGWAAGMRGTGIVAYSMGLGKTFIAIRTCEGINRKKVLIVCPSHLKHNWRNEIGLWQPCDSAHICEGRVSALSNGDRFTIINRDILADNLPALLKQGFDQIVVDECHKVGGWGTGAYKALDTLCKATRERSGGILLMTGTLNSPMDAHTALHLLDPKIPGSREAFQIRFDPIGKKREEVKGLMMRKSAPRWLIGKKWAEIKKLEKERGKNGDVEGLRWLLAQYAIRKSYHDVFPDDSKTRETKFVSVDLDLTDNQKRILANRGVDDDGAVKGELATVLRVVAEAQGPLCRRSCGGVAGGIRRQEAHHRHPPHRGPKDHREGAGAVWCRGDRRHPRAEDQG